MIPCQIDINNIKFENNNLIYVLSGDSNELSKTNCKSNYKNKEGEKEKPKIKEIISLLENKIESKNIYNKKNSSRIIILFLSILYIFYIYSILIFSSFKSIIIH